MAIKTFYLNSTAAASPEWMGRLADGTPPATVRTTFGWGVGNNFDTFFRGRIGANQPTTTAGGTGAPSSRLTTSSGPQAGTGVSNTTAGDSFRSVLPYLGKFAAGTWTFTFTVQAVNTAPAGQMNTRLWASSNANGSSARVLSNALYGNNVTLSVAGTNYNSIASTSLAEIILLNEYLFIQMEWYCTGGSAASNVFFSVGAAQFTTPDYIDGDFGPPLQTNAIVIISA